MNRAELVQTLELIKPALRKDNTIPIFQCFTFQNNGTVTAYDDTIAITGPSELEENCGIHGNTLLGLLSNSSAEEVDITLKGGDAIIECGKTVSKLTYEAEDAFIFEAPDGKWTGSLPYSESFDEAIKMCLDTVSSDTTQVALAGITIDGDKMFSCNSDAVTRIQLTKGAKNRVLMPTPFCEAMTRLWSETAVTKGQLYFNDDWVFADFGDWEIYGRLLEIKDPIDFEALIKKTVKTKVPTQPLPEGFSEALSRARVLADPESKKTNVGIKKGVMKLHTESHIGEIKDDFAMKGHPDVDTSIHAANIQKALGYCDQMAFHENCTVFEKAPNVLLVVSNLS